jgi:hypothetical protein
LLIDDALFDRSQELANRHPGIRVLRDPVRRGVGAALRLGIAEAKHPLLFYAPCDNRYRPKDLYLLLDQIDKTHVVTGHRVGRKVPLLLRILGLAWRCLFRVLFGLPLEPLPGWLGWRDHARNLLVRIFLGVQLHDAQCEFRLFRRSVFRRIPIQSDGQFAHVEILAKANFLTAVMSDVPVSYNPLSSPPSWWKDAWRVFAHPDFGPAVLPPEPTITQPCDGPPQPAVPQPAFLPADGGTIQQKTDQKPLASNGDPSAPRPQPASGTE